MNRDNNQVQFLVTLRPAEDGQTDALLRLYRDKRPVSESIVSNLAETKARMILLKTRMQLFRLGYDEHVPVLRRATELRLATASPRHRIVA